MEDSNSMAVSIKEIAECVQGEVLNSQERLGEMVKSVMVGAMCVDPSPMYFGLKADKAVITRGDRMDIQLGALETSIKCLVLTGGVKPSQMVLERAKEKKAPVIVVKEDTPTTLARLEQCLGAVRSTAPTPTGETTPASGS